MSSSKFSVQVCSELSSVCKDTNGRAFQSLNREKSSGFGNPRSALVSRLIQYCSAESLVISLWASVSSALRKWILKMCCAQKLHIVRKFWGIRHAIPNKTLRDCVSVHTQDSGVHRRSSLQPGHIQMCPSIYRYTKCKQYVINFKKPIWLPLINDRKLHVKDKIRLPSH